MSNDEKYSVVYSPVLWGRSVLHGTFSRFLAEPYKTKPCQTADLQGVFFLCRSHAALKDRLPALQACGLIKTPWRDDWQLLFSPPTPIRPPFFPLRFEESALQASRRCAEECQETLWWSEPAADEQRRSGRVTREQCMCWEGGGG